MKKLKSIHINITKAFKKAFYIYRYKGIMFTEFTFVLYFIEINFQIIYKKIYKPEQWSKEERAILERQGKPPLKINKIKV